MTVKTAQSATRDTTALKLRLKERLLIARPLYMMSSPLFRLLQVRYSGMNRGKDYARQRHDSAHMKNTVQENKEIRILGNSDNAPHDFRYALSSNASKTTTANHDIDARLGTHAPGLNADTSLSQGEIGKGEGLRAKRGGKVNTASSGEFHFDNLFCDLCEPLKRLYRNLWV